MDDMIVGQGYPRDEKGGARYVSLCMCSIYVRTSPWRSDLTDGPVDFQSTRLDWRLEIQENKIKIKLSTKFFSSDGHIFVTPKPIWVKYFKK